MFSSKLGFLGLSAVLFALSAAPSLATMPQLTPMPSKRTVEACNEWAGLQDEEATTMWGVVADGGSNEALGRHRLISACLSEPVSDIVGFGSSAGFDDEYCGRHPEARVCGK